VLALAGALALKARLGRGNGLPRFAVGNRRLRLEECLRINPQTEIAIVSCDGHEMLIAATPAGASVLRTLPAKEVV